MPQRARLKPRYAPQFSAKQLRAFIALSETLSFTESARRLNITQPSLTALLKQLEKHACAPLVIRDTREVRLSAHGQAFLPDALRLHSQLAQTAALARHLAAEAKEVLRLAAPVELLTHTIARVLGQFKAVHPDLEVQLQCFDTDEALRALQYGEIDLAFVTQIKPPEGVALEPLAALPMAALLPQAHRLASKSAVRWDELSRERVITAKRPQSVSQQVQVLLARQAIELDLHDDADDLLALIGLMELGMGVGLVSGAVRDLLADRPIVVRPLIDPVIELHLALALPRVSVAPAAALFREMVFKAQWGWA